MAIQSSVPSSSGPAIDPEYPRLFLIMDKPRSREGLDAAHVLVQPGSLDHEVQVVFENLIIDQPQPVVGSLMRPSIQEDLKRIRTGEDRQPFQNGVGQKMGLVLLLNDATTSGHEFFPSTMDAGAWERSLKISETFWYIETFDDQWVALLGFSAPALKCSPRDRWSG